MARSRRRNTNRRQWVWARQSGFFGGTTSGRSGFGAVDLLADARTRWGNAALRGATVSTIKGVIRPAATLGNRIFGIAGVRVCSIADVREVATEPQEAPFNDGLYEDWMMFFPYDVTMPATDAGGFSQILATGNPANSWNVDVQSSRVLTDLGLTLGLFWYQTSVTGTVQPNMDGTLSVGLKLP